MNEKGDLISRQTVINAIANTCFWLSANNWEELTKCINSIPTVENKEEKNIAIKFCHEHKLLMIPVEAYHKLNVAYNAYMMGISYEEAEKKILKGASE